MKFVVVIFIIFQFACSQTSSKPKLKATDIEYYPTYTIHLEDTLRTLELTNTAWACQCANWGTAADIKRFEENKVKLADTYIFIEPADISLELPDTLGYQSDLIRFTGQFYKEKGYPKNYPKTEMEVDTARVFRYTKFEVLKSNYNNYKYLDLDSSSKSLR
jgi:hypothetical protein